MHLIVADAQRFVKMPLSPLAGILIVVVVVVQNVHNSSKCTTMIQAQLFQCPFNNSKSISCR